MNRIFPESDHPTKAPAKQVHHGESCSMDHEGESLIRMTVATPLEGSTVETDRIINQWKPRLHGLVCSANSMFEEMRRPRWKPIESYPCCGFLNIVGPEDISLRTFIDEACVVLLSALPSDEIIAQAYWPDDRKCDARDIREWLERWSGWLPDEEGQFRFWSSLMDCDPVEAFYRYVYSLVYQCYLEILEKHHEAVDDCECEEESWEWNRGDLESLPDFYPIPGEILYYHPRLLLDGRAFWLTDANAEELREWAYEAFRYWYRKVDQTRIEALVMAALEADKLCPEQRWP